MSYSAAWKRIFDLRRREDGAERLELGGAAERDRVDEPAAVVGRDLDQADLVEVVVEAVGFGVEGDDLFTQQLLGESLEVGPLRDDFVVAQFHLAGPTGTSPAPP